MKSSTNFAGQSVLQEGVRVTQRVGRRLWLVSSASFEFRVHVKLNSKPGTRNPDYGLVEYWLAVEYRNVSTTFSLLRTITQVEFLPGAFGVMAAAPDKTGWPSMDSITSPGRSPALKASVDGRTETTSSPPVEPKRKATRGLRATVSIPSALSDPG